MSDIHLGVIEDLPPSAHERDSTMEKKFTKILPIIESGGDALVGVDLWHEIHSRSKLKEQKKSIARPE